jgi:hypothetical protein
MARVDKADFVEHIDPGVPLDAPKKGNSQVLVLYNSPASVPEMYREADNLNQGNQNPHLDTATALENCEMLNVVLQHNTGGRKQCVAIVPQYESFHIQKWMRPLIDLDSNATNRHPLALVSRGKVEKGVDRFRPPRGYETEQYWNWLRNFLGSMEEVLAELKPILERVAVDNTVIVLVCNFGQSELLLNFICSAKSRGFDLGRVILFATDEETKELAEAHGIAAYYDHRVRRARFCGGLALARLVAVRQLCPFVDLTLRRVSDPPRSQRAFVLRSRRFRTSRRPPNRPRASTATTGSSP